MMGDKVKTLDQMHHGERGVVRRITGGWRIHQRLNQLGLHLGDPLEVKHNSIWGGPVLIEVHGIQMALGRGMARHVEVSIVPTGHGTSDVKPSQ